jgi:hypothetical protein
MRGTVVCALALVALAGCGGESTERGDVTKSVRSWTDAMSRADGKQACARMTPAAAHELAAFGRSIHFPTNAPDCVTNAHNLANKLTPNALHQMHDADVDDIHIDGSTAVVHMAGGGPNEVVLRRQGGKWRIDQAFRKGWRLVGSPTYGLGG